MARTAEAYAALRADLELALEHVLSQYEDLERTLRRAEADFDRADPMAWAAVGFMLHNLYNAIENYNRMGHEVPELRPALLPRDQLDPFHELRSFRHTFRSLYDRKLDPRRVRLAAEYAVPAVDTLKAGHRRFVADLDELARSL